MPEEMANHWSLLEKADGNSSKFKGQFVVTRIRWRFDMLRMLTPVIGDLLYGIGVMMGNAKFNLFVGIRTPLTLSSEEV